MTDACLMDTLQPDAKQYNLSFHAMDNYANWCRWNSWCNVKSHVFTFEWYSNYQQIQSLAFDQHEIATETISLQQGLQDKGYEEWVGEMIGMREILRHFANVSTNDVVGMRAPYLKPGRNAQYQVGFALKFSSLVAYLCSFCVCMCMQDAQSQAPCLAVQCTLYIQILPHIYKWISYELYRYSHGTYVFVKNPSVATVPITNA